MEAANEEDEPAHIQRLTDLLTEYISLEQRAGLPPDRLRRPSDCIVIVGGGSGWGRAGMS